MTATAGRPLARGLPRGRLPLAWYVTAAVAPLILLGAWGLSLVSRPGAGTPAVAQVGEPAPAFTLNDLDGAAVSLAALRGRPVIVHFWASWCVPCRDEFPLLKDAIAAHGGSDLAVIGIVYRDSSSAARAFMAQMGAAWPATIDPDDGVANRYGIIGPPDTFFIDRSGVVLGRQIGQLSASDLDRGLARILGKE